MIESKLGPKDLSLETFTEPSDIGLRISSLKAFEAFSN
jgi:hypothetical protein